MTQLELDVWLEGYLSYRRDVRRVSPRTLIDVRCTLKRVSEFMAGAHPGVPLWKLRLEDYLHWLSEARAAGRSENALAKDLSHLRGLLDYAWRSGRAQRNVLDGFSIQDSQRKVEPRSLTLDEARRLVHCCSRQTVEQRRDRLVVLVLYGCGLRTDELRLLDVGDVDIERQELVVRHGKGQRQRTIPVPSSVWVELLAYLHGLGAKRGALFRTLVKRRRIQSHDITQIVTVAAARASIAGKVTPRTLRHTFATHLMDAGVDLAVIASLMGHRSPAETGVYLHMLPGKERSAVRLLIGDKEGKQ